MKLKYFIKSRVVSYILYWSPKYGVFTKSMEKYINQFSLLFEVFSSSSKFICNLQFGQSFWSFSHFVRQSLWKKCLHLMSKIISSSLKASRQIVHVIFANSFSLFSGYNSSIFPNGILTISSDVNPYNIYYYYC